MTDVVCDASVVLGWFREEGEREVEESRALLDASKDGRVALRLLELTYQEVGNSLIRRHGVTAARTITVFEAMRAFCGDPLGASLTELEVAARLAESHRLTLYDALYAAVAARRGAVLVTLDRELVAGGLGETPAVLVGRLGL